MPIYQTIDYSWLQIKIKNFTAGFNPSTSLKIQLCIGINTFLHISNSLNALENMSVCIHLCVCVYIYVKKYFVVGPKGERNILKSIGPGRHLYFFMINLFISFLHTCMFPAYCFRQWTYMAQRLVNGVLNETWTHSGFKFELFPVVYGFI